MIFRIKDSKEQEELVELRLESIPDGTIYLMSYKGDSSRFEFISKWNVQTYGGCSLLW
jgi:hypothetical protein